MLRLLICGANGKMGRLLAETAKESADFLVCAGIDKNVSKGLGFPILSRFEDCPEADCIIDFSSPKAIYDLLNHAVKYHIPVVLASTGYNESENKFIENAALKIPIFKSSNLSHGMNAFREASKYLCKSLENEYDIAITETHHKYKHDTPSGTAITLKNELSKLRGKEIDVLSIRGGGVFGEHTVIFMSDGDVIEITHRALNRKIFALGALEAARFITAKKRGIYAKTQV